MFTAESPSVPTKCETQIPSTMLYRDMKTIVIMLGIENNTNERKVNFFAKELLYSASS